MKGPSAWVVDKITPVQYDYGLCAYGQRHEHEYEQLFNKTK